MFFGISIEVYFFKVFMNIFVICFNSELINIVFKRNVGVINKLKLNFKF